MLGQVQRCLSPSVKWSSKSHTVQIQSGPVRRAGWWNSGWWCENILQVIYFTVCHVYFMLCGCLFSCSYIWLYLRHAHITKPCISLISNMNIFHLVTIATDRMAKVPASKSGGGCQGDGAAPIPCILYFGKGSLLLWPSYVRFWAILKSTSRDDTDDLFCAHWNFSKP